MRHHTFENVAAAFVPPAGTPYARAQSNCCSPACKEDVVSVRLTVLSVILLCVAGCAAESREVNPATPATMGLGDVRTRDPLLGSQCRVSCTVSPGAGCC